MGEAAAFTDIDAIRERKDEIADLIGNRWWRLNNLYWITNEKGEVVRFIPNKSQERFYFDMWWNNVIVKSRQQGFSTFIQILMLDACIFNDNIRAGVIAHNKDDAKIMFRDKIKFAYDRLPPWLKQQARAAVDSSNELSFSNGSSIRVGTSMRSGTLQYLHVSELGKIGRKYPEKDQEIRAGSLNTVHEDGFIFFESTAEGRHGLFYETAMMAQIIEQMGRKPNRMEFKLHFFPWWLDARNRMDPLDLVITAEEKHYFMELERTENIVLDESQKAWYAMKARQQMDKMKQEHPSTMKEAFEVQLKGSIYGDYIARARIERRITRVHHDPNYRVNTFWDIGRNDLNIIWFHQRVGTENRFIDYYENRFESLDFYAGILHKYAAEKRYVFGRHYLPHDVEVTDVSRGDNLCRREVLESLGIRPIVKVDRIPDLMEGVNMMRQAFGSCWFDEVACDAGLKALEHYQFEWNDQIQEFRNRPKEDWASHAADAIRQFAQGYRASSEVSLGNLARKDTKRRTRNWRTV